jgi:hypothetical protein
MTQLHPAVADMDPRLTPLDAQAEVELGRALDPVAAWLSHEHELWRPRDGRPAS